jgi:hypothetical protein
MRAVPIPASSEPRPSSTACRALPSSATTSTCPKQRSATVAHGQQRSLTEVPDLHHRWKAGSPTLLPELAVSHAGTAGAFLPAFCPTDLTPAARTRITLDDQSTWTPADQGECD